MKKLLFTSLILIAGINVAMTQGTITIPVDRNWLIGSAPIEHTVCQGTTVILTFSYHMLSGYNYVWEQHTGFGNPDDDNTWMQHFDFPLSFTPALGTSGTTRFRWRAIHSGGSWIGEDIRSREVWITVNSAPAQPGNITGSASVCRHTAQTFSIGAVSSATSYTWTLPSGWTGSSTGTSISATPGPNAVNGNISVTANNSCGSSPARTLQVTVNSAPAQPGNIAGSASVCRNTAQTFSIGAVSGAASYTWTLPSGWTGSSTGTSISATPGPNAVNGDIRVRANNNCGSSPDRTLAVTIVNNAPEQPGNITGSTSVCRHTAQTFSIGAVSGATSYTWILPGGWTGSSTGTSISATPGPNAVNGNISVTANNNCGSSPVRTLPVTVNNAPEQPGNITGSTTVCRNMAQIFSIGAVSGATSYTWTLPSGWTADNFTGTSILAIPGPNAANGNISVSANNNCGAGIERILQVTVSDGPTISSISTPAALCVGDHLTLPTPTVTNATSEQGWQIETDVGTGLYTNLTLPHPISLADHGRRIHYRAVNNCGTQYSNAVTITVIDIPTISSISAPAAHCVGNHLTLPTPTVAHATSDRGWQIETGFDTDEYINLVQPHPVSLADHGRRLRYRAANRCSTQFSNTVMIAVDAGPSAFTRLYDERVCRDNTITVNFSGTGIDASRTTWTNSNPNIGLAATSGEGNLNFTAINPTDSAISSTITVTPVSASGCSNLGLAQSFSITVYPSLNAGTIDSMGQAVALNGLADAIGNVNDAWGGDGNIQYRWRRNNTIVDGATGATHIPRTNAVGTFIYTREAKDGACNDWVSCSGEWVLTVIQASITGTDRICIGATTQLSSTIDGTWESSHSGIASVTNEGLVRGLSQGAATFTFTARDINFQATTELVFVSGEMLPEVNNIVAKTDISGIPYILIYLNPTGDYGFQWYHNGDRIEGATGQFFYPAGGLQAGEYKVYVYRSHLRVCGRFTASYQISLPLMSASAEWFFLYPNPSDGRFSVVFNKDIICDETTVTIGLFSLQGARIMEHQVTGLERFEFDENLNNGIYVLRITTDSNLSETRQIIIQN